MKKLPKYFAIKKDEENPLWWEYIDWLNEKYNVAQYRGVPWNGGPYVYYGYDGHIKGHGTNCHDHKFQFQNNPTLITIEEWNECINGFVLPEKWYVEYTKEQSDIIKEFRNDKYSTTNKASAVLHSDLTIYQINKPGYAEITFEQFKKYVLMKDKKIIGYKLKDKYKKFKKAAESIMESPMILKELQNFDVSSEFNLRKLREAKVLDLWFEPVYAPQYSLPKINGYDGIVDQYGILTYGCAKIHNSQLRLILQYNSVGGNKADSTPYRSIKSIKLSSDVEITIEQIKQILDYIDNR